MDRLKAPWQIAGVAKETPVLLALSGGADSRALLHILVQMAKRDGFLLVAAHVEHGIRGAESLRDMEFCRSLAQEYGISLALHRADVPSLAREHGRGLEEEAREVRYKFFEAQMRERSIPLLVTAHHADDNAETVLFRMARGSTLAGLGGIATVRPFANGSLVRPLLGVTKREILAYCEQEKLQYVIDQTNADTSYARNRLRTDVLPAMESLFDGATRRISEMSMQLREDEELLSVLTERFLEEHCVDRRCPVDRLMQQPVAMQRRILLAWFSLIGGGAVERVHVDALLRLCREGREHASLSLPNRICVSLERGALCEHEDSDFIKSEYLLPLREGETDIPGTQFSIFVKKVSENLKIHNLSTAQYIILNGSFDIMKNKLCFRPRREGDRILKGGMHREVRRLCREAGLSLPMRRALPVLCDGEEIVWIPYVGARDGVQTRSFTEDGVLVMLRCRELD